MNTPAVPPAPARRRRHLIDPNAPRVAPTKRDQHKLTQVQRWVLTFFAVGVIGLHSAAMAAAPLAYDSGVPGAKVALLLISAFFGMMAVVAARMIHKKSPLTPLLILGWIPAAIFYFVYFG